MKNLRQMTAKHRALLRTGVHMAVQTAARSQPASQGTSLPRGPRARLSLGSPRRVLFFPSIFQPIGLSSPRKLEAWHSGRGTPGPSQGTRPPVLTMAEGLLCGLKQVAIPLWVCFHNLIH